MIKPDWRKFQAKFSENPQNNFEWFCYLLFCKEFHQFYIPRFKNQAAIETMPIVNGEDTIVWQAKFYETALSKSKHIKDITDSIKKSKEDFPKITKIIFYTNQEWGQNKEHGEPKGKIQAEKTARDLKVDIEWRTASFFETSFVTIDNEIISRYFFSLDESIFNVIKEKQIHTESVLSPIHSSIHFKEEEIEIDRSGTVQQVEEYLKQKQAIVLSGTGGVGKTAIVKKIYEKYKDIAPFFVFKASEFKLGNINDLFNGVGFYDFVKFYEENTDKIIVIDSAEKVLDIENGSPFEEFLTGLVKNNWRIIFTTRNNFVEDLNYRLIEIYKVSSVNLEIKNLNQEDLEKMSLVHSFSLPQDKRVFDLIKNPFYLNEYLQLYEEGKAEYEKFKEKLWNRVIKKNKPQRERCFLKIAFERADKASFFVDLDFEGNILEELVNDGILGYETAGYFITHDIYEEWALEKIIESEFVNAQNYIEYFDKIGESLSIRRSFRNWMSEKLMLQRSDIRQLIEYTIEESDIKKFWKDELMISILLSEHSETFFDSFKESLLKNNQEMLKRITFLLRIACKEINSDFLKQIGVSNNYLYFAKYIPTRPKGSGWNSLINFIYDNLQEIGIKNIYFILPVIYDWNSNFKQGKTTRLSSLIALSFYSWSVEEEVIFYHDDDIEEKLLQTILNGASEIKEELKGVFEDILKNSWRNHRDPYYDLVKAILTELGNNLEVIKTLPDYVIQLADLFWSRNSGQAEDYCLHSMDLETAFSIEGTRFDYFPASAYQTPAYWLLQFSFEETLNFILNFTDKTVRHFAESSFAENEIREVEVYIDDSKLTKQYVCDRVWTMHRGTGTAPYILESMHMALEKYLLEKGKEMDPKTLEYWLLYLLNHSQSSSITAIAASIVLAYPEKTFNVAKILFKTKELFFLDTRRYILDTQQKSTLVMFASLRQNRIEGIYDQERIEACDDEHRTRTLESLIVTYQFFRSEETTEKEFKGRQKTIWAILDKYYRELPDKNKEEESDKVWRLYLARMDRRKMSPKIEKNDGKTFIQFNPEVDPELKEYSEKSLKESTELLKYSPLKLWADYKMKNDAQYKQYEQYENNYKLALKEAKEIIKTLVESNDGTFYLFNHSTPAYVCSVLIRDYFEVLSTNEKEYCKKYVLKKASSFLRDDYQYQAGDGIEYTIFVLPLLLKYFPSEREKIKKLLLLALFNTNYVGGNLRFANYPVNAIICNLWEWGSEDAQSILLGYLLLKPKYEERREYILERRRKEYIYEYKESEIRKWLINNNKKEIARIVDNTISIKDLSEIEKIDLDILCVAIQLIPLKTENETQNIIIKSITFAFSKQLLSGNREDKVDYSVRYSFFERLAYFVLGSSEDKDSCGYLKPFVDNLNGSEAISELFKEFILVEDRVNNYKKFWQVWEMFYDKIVILCKNGDRHRYTEEIIKSYLFAQTLWEERVADWHTLKEDNKPFFKKISNDIGHCPSTLYSISKLLNGVGSVYIDDDGINWIFTMVRKSTGIKSDRLEADTVFYIENLIKKYIYKNRERIKKVRRIKEEVMAILNFLVDKGSVTGYMLREDIL